MAHADNHEDPGYKTRALPEEAQANAATVREIPNDQLPWPDVRAALIARAEAGYDCYAYTHASLSDLLPLLLPENPEDAALAHARSLAAQPRWTIWDRQRYPWQEARFTPRQWAIEHGFSVDGPEGGDAA